ncbi:hypothetical protein CcaCcLH18_12697 [Colletotrichum camelliae]|nr:hypothetical protein CcaCcLH18_12697 [Colletotrichum camelliae]
MFEQLKGIDSELLQVWFPGVHINVGGGNPSIIAGGDSDFEQIALISFAWMCEQIGPFLQLVDDRENYITPTCGLAERECKQREILIEDSRVIKDNGSFWATQYAWWVLDVTGIYKAPLKRLPKLPRFGWALGTIVDSFQGVIRLAHASLVLLVATETKTTTFTRRMSRFIPQSTFACRNVLITIHLV